MLRLWAINRTHRLVCDQGANAIGLPLLIIIFGFIYVILLARYMIKVKIPPKPKLNVNKAVTSMLVLSAVSKFKRGIIFLIKILEKISDDLLLLFQSLTQKMV